MPYTHTVTRAITLSASATPPTEFQIFRRGANATAKGVFNFDASAAKQVIAAYERQGTDLCIDLEHDSLSPERRAQRSDAADARGYFKLSLRPDGSLWAVAVRWSKDGARRLQERTQRYISPAFAVEGDRPTQLVNCALCAAPATYNAQALVAASRTEILSARVTPAARAALYLMASKRKQTISAVLLGALDTITDAGSTAPTRDQVATLKAVCSALGLPSDVAAETLKSAFAALLEAAATPEPSNADPLAATAEPPPQPNAHFAKLSADQRASLAKRGITTLAQFNAAKAALVRRTPSKPTKAK